MVINYNGRKWLEGCFSSLERIEGSENVDIILIDNNSNDGSVELVSKSFPRVEVVQTGSNLGFSGAYNYAHKHLKSSSRKYLYYFILNNDTVVSDKKLFSRIDKLFTANKKIGIINSTIVDEGGMIQFQGGNYIFWTGTTLGRNGGKGYSPRNATITSKWATGCALFIPQELFEQVGGFDDYFMYQEDVGLSWKVINAGYEVITDCGSSITHFAGGTTKASTFEHYYSERNRMILYYQNLSLPIFILTLPVLLVARILLLPIQRSLPIALAKLKGNLVGLAIMWRYPRYNNLITRDIKTISLFTRKLTEHENSLSNS